MSHWCTIYLSVAVWLLTHPRCPPGHRLFVSDGWSNIAASRIVGQARSGQDGPEDLAVTPDGATLYAVNAASVVPVATATGRTGRPLGTGLVGTSVVFTPDSRTGYVLGEDNTVIPFDVRTATVGRPIVIGPQTASAWAMAITPDGKTIYVANYGTGTVVPVSTATGTAGRPIRVGYEPTFIAITPDGATAYVPTGPSAITAGWPRPAGTGGWHGTTTRPWATSTAAPTTGGPPGMADPVAGAS